MKSHWTQSASIISSVTLLFAGNLLAADGDQRTFDFGKYGSISATETIHTPGVWEGRIDGKDAAAGGWLMQIETNVGRVLVAHGADGRVLQSLPLGNGTFNVFEQEAPFGGIA